MEVMPIHDWTRVDAGLFHDFHQTWTVALQNALNAGALPPEYYALIAPPAHGSAAEVSERDEIEIYAARANRVTVHHRDGKIVGVIAVVSPGNKYSRSEFRAFVDESVELLRRGVHLLMVDLFPPGQRDLHGMHATLWAEFDHGGFDPPPDKPLTLAAYDAGPPCAAYVEPVAVGDMLPDMPLFLKPEHYVSTPLERTYQAAWDVFPAVLKRLLEAPPAAP
jgi:hypothetical protein